MPRRPGEALLCSWVEGLLLLSSRGSCAWTMMEREALAALSPAECSMRQARGGCLRACPAAVFKGSWKIVGSFDV